MVVSYRTGNHLSVIFQRKGSHFHKILPHCLLNVIVTITLRILSNRYNLTWLGISSQGHTLATVIISFLLVTRVNMSLTRYNDTRSSIGRMYAETRELLMNVCTYTKQMKTQNDCEWRYEIAYRALILLRSVMVLLKYPEHKINLWSIPELNGTELDYVKSCILTDDYDKIVDKNNKKKNSTSFFNRSVPHSTPAVCTTGTIGTSNDNDNENQLLQNIETGVSDDISTVPVLISSQQLLVRKYRHNIRSLFDENLRVPIRIEYLVRLTIQSHTERLSTELPLLKENRLLTNIDNFMIAYYSIRRFLTTPTPFPLIQMTRTLLFAYIYTIPFVFLGDPTKGKLVYHCLAVFVLTYGYIGLEMVAIELDDPFGKDDNDLDADGMAEKTFEDIYLNIYDIDGPVWTDKLHSRMVQS